MYLCNGDGKNPHPKAYTVCKGDSVSLPLTWLVSEHFILHYETDWDKAMLYLSRVDYIIGFVFCI